MNLPGPHPFEPFDSLPHTCRHCPCSASATIHSEAARHYQHRPAPSGLHAKYLAELSEGSPYIVQSLGGTPNHIVVSRRGATVALWHGHRDLMPTEYRGASDPDHLLTRPASD